MTKALVIGFGNVAQALAEMIVSRGETLLLHYGFFFSAIGIFTRTRGNAVAPEGLDLADILRDFPASMKREGRTSGMTPLEACYDLDYDVLIELSPLTVADCGEPAVSHIKAALSRGRDAVTANKGPVAFAHDELMRLAERNGGRFLFESTVMDGAPIFSLASRCMKGNAVTGFSGVLNSTTNYILTRMEEGCPLSAAVDEAVKAGIAEADPTNDVDGWDAAVKTSVLARVLMGIPLSPLDVERSGIGSVTSAEIRGAIARNKRLKLVCRAYRDDRGTKASVALEELDAGHLLAGLSSFDSALCLETELMAPICLVQKDPTPRDTAFGVLEDLLSLKR